MMDKLKALGGYVTAPWGVYSAWIVAHPNWTGALLIAFAVKAVL